MATRLLYCLKQSVKNRAKENKELVKELPSLVYCREMAEEIRRIAALISFHE